MSVFLSCFITSIGLLSTCLDLSEKISHLITVSTQILGGTQQKRCEKKSFQPTSSFRAGRKVECYFSVQNCISLSSDEERKVVDILKQKHVTRSSF